MAKGQAGTVSPAQRRLWWAVPLPGLLGVLLSVAMGSPPAADLPVAQAHVYLSADVAGLAWVVGLGLSIVAAGGLALRSHCDRRCAARVARVQAAAAEERRRFLRRLDHELKNPLTAIGVELANLEAATAAPAKGRGDATGGDGADAWAEAPLRPALAGLKAQTARIGRLVGDLRKLAELETRPLTFDVVDMTEVLTEVVAAVEDSGLETHGRPAGGVTLMLPQAPWPLPAVEGDHDLLFLAIYNLVSNARKFTGPGDTIELRAFEDGPEVVVEVADTGPGIPEAEQALVWEELYRAQAARGVPGSGLGLALVRTVVARHGGSAMLRSREGQGTVVTVRLPVRAG